MITSNDVRTAQFETVKKGYNPIAVDALLEKVADRIDEMTVEKNEIEQQMILLADKLEEYRADEDKIRTTLLGAQKMSDTIMRESKQKAEILLRDANIKSERLVDASHQRIVREEQVLDTLKKEVAKFKNDILGIYKNHLEALSLIPDYDGAPEAEQAETEPVQPEAEQEVVETFNADEFEVEIPHDDEPEQLGEHAEQFEQPEAEQPAAANEYSAEDFSLDIPGEEDNDTSTKSKFGKLDFGDDFSFEK